MAAAVSPLRGADVQAKNLQQQFHRHWKKKVRKLPPAQRLAWLESNEGIIAFDAARREEIVKGIGLERERVTRLMPGEEWLAAWMKEGRKVPIDTPDTGRRYSVRWRLGAGYVRYGDEGRPSRRWTPPQAVDVEDFLDLMGDLEAKFYSFPPSPSAVAIHRMTTYSGAGLRRLMC